MIAKIRQRIFISKSGISLVEIMMTIFIFSIILVGLYTVILVGEDSWQANKVKIRLNQELRKAYDWMEYDLREAGISSVVNLDANGVAQSSIIFRIPAGVTAGSIVWEPDAIEFALGGTNNTQLLRKQGSTVKVLANNISSISFVRYASSPHMLEVDIVAQDTTPKGNIIHVQDHYNVQLRNH